MIRKLFLSLTIGISLLVQSQDYKDEILMTIDDRKITLGEFERIYKKNNSNPSIEQQSVEEYLELFINFKLKVIEAEERGMDTTEAFLREFNSYKKQLAKPYLSDKEEVQALVQEAFQRAQYDIHASHILIRFDEFASPEDTLKAYEKTIQIRERLLAGEDFGTVARATSDDPSVKTNSGDLGFFTVFRMVYPFETGVYSTPPGQISMPVRTRFGYHLIKVYEKRPAVGQVRVAHIMILTPETMSSAELDKARIKIYQLYDSLKMRADFSEIARKYSEDRGSAANGGEIQWFGTGRMVPEFEKASFAIKKAGEFSEPVKTSFGWHIIKLLEKKGVDNYEVMKPELESMVTRSDRSIYSRNAMIQKIKKQYDYKEFPGNIDVLYTYVDTTIFERKWNMPETVRLDKLVFTIGNRKFTQKDFTSYLLNNQGGRKMDIRVFLNNKFSEFINNSVLQYEEDQLENKYLDFKNLVQEYHDGILLFDLTDRMVWSKAIQDTIGLQAFYQEHKDNYMWNERIDATIYSCRDEIVANKAKSLLTKKSNKKITPEEIVSNIISEFNDSSCIQTEKGIFEKGDDNLVDQMDWNTDISANMKRDDKTVFIVRNKIIKPTPKKLDEARGLITADYQAYLEKLWIQELRNKYPVEVNRSLLSKIE